MAIDLMVKKEYINHMDISFFVFSFGDFFGKISVGSISGMDWKWFNMINPQKRR